MGRRATDRSPYDARRFPLHLGVHLDRGCLGPTIGRAFEVPRSCVAKSVVVTTEYKQKGGKRRPSLCLSLLSSYKDMLNENGGGDPSLSVTFSVVNINVAWPTRSITRSESL